MDGEISGGGGGTSTCKVCVMREARSSIDIGWIHPIAREADRKDGWMMVVHPGLQTSILCLARR